MRILEKIKSKLKPKRIEVDAALLKKSIASHFVMFLREEGWKGSGFHFQRIKHNQIIELISLYPSRYGGDFFIEVGIHFEFIKLAVPCEVMKMTTTSVDIRTRLTLSGNSKNEWEYPNSLKGLKLLNENLIRIYSSEGKDFFTLFNDWESDLIELKKQDIENKNGKIPFPTKTRTARILAYVNLEQGEIDNAKELAKYGLGLTNGRNGSALIPDFEEILQHG